ncbi:MAG TPA: capsule assembly Wzi family protein, partial [Terriglobales bacterium]|nr:capsule assembly Wzi family protein [Terriglobales bacterium]
TYSLVGAAAGGYLWGHITNNDHLRETGLLATEAMIGSVGDTFVLKGITQRTRPLDAGDNASFFRGGNSFPSQHAAIAWSVASILAHEYPGPLTKFLAYGLASGVSVSRVTSKEHFASDAFIGSALGWYFGRQVYRAHHDPELGGTAWGSSAPNFEGRSPLRHASSYVPLDSWVYAAMERLAAWGYIQTSMLGQRPWTRDECTRLLEEAEGGIPKDESPSNEASKIYRSLEEELLPERNGSAGNTFHFRLNSIYTRTTQISGTPLTDSYNFASTIVNDYGRPFQEGTNNYTGIAASGSAGALSFYFRAEYQHSPSAEAIPDAARLAIASTLGVPAAPATPFSEINRVRLVEGYVSLNVRGLQFSFGKQALWWGPTETGALLASTNAEPITMLRISNAEPFKLPSIFGFLGPMRSEFFIGQLQGQQYILGPNGMVGPASFSPQPFIHGQKLSFKPTPNLEFGFSRTVVFAGLGHPFTFNSFIKSVFNVTSNGSLDVSGDAGDRRSGFDFSYRLPYLRKWLTLYSDSFCEDDVSPLAAPRRCAWSPGLYLAKFPGLNKLDFRAEGVYTAVPGLPPGTNYQNIIYRSGYTNDGNILGSWVGRQGNGVQLWSTYWLTPENKIQLAYRHQGVDKDFLQGGWLDDLSVRTDFSLSHDVTLSATAQHENWNFPLLADRTKSNVSVSIGLTFRPNLNWSH